MIVENNTLGVGWGVHCEMSTFKQLGLTTELLRGKKWPRFISCISLSQEALPSGMWGKMGQFFISCSASVSLLGFCSNAPQAAKKLVFQYWRDFLLLPYLRCFSCCFSCQSWLCKAIFRTYDLKIPVMSLCLQSYPAEKLAVPPVVKAKEDFVVDYTWLYMQWSFDRNQTHWFRHVEVPGSCKCQSFSVWFRGCSIDLQVQLKDLRYLIC